MNIKITLSDKIFYQNLNYLTLFKLLKNIFIINNRKFKLKKRFAL